MTERSDIDRAAETMHRRHQSDIIGLRAEIERLQKIIMSTPVNSGLAALTKENIDMRAALKQIDEHRLFVPERDAYMELKEIARAARGGK